MEAKGTVMSGSELDTRLCDYAINFSPEDMTQILRMLRVQAEISFPLGEASVAKAVLAIIENPKQVSYRLKEITEYCEARNEGFKAGYEKGLAEQGSPRADAEIRLADKEYAELYRKAWADGEVEIISFRAGKEAGIREVMEWERELCSDRSHHSSEFMEKRYCNVCRMFKLKEWGIE